MPLITLREFVRKKNEEALHAARTKFRDSVKPIYCADLTGKLEHVGTGILLNLLEANFLLTAAHVWDWGASGELCLGGNKLIKLDGRAITSEAPKGLRQDDVFDWAIIPLKSTILTDLSGAKFITEADINNPAPDPLPGQRYACLGYPNSRNKIKAYSGSTLIPMLLPYVAQARPSSMLPKASNSAHILLAYSAKYVRDESGAKTSAVAMRGCSGGAIIDIGRLTKDTLDDTVYPLLSGLFIEAHTSEGVILGTRVAAILANAKNALLTL